MADTKTKVFVGNLSFATTEEALAKHFAVAGPVVSANIITRGPRSLGYGFVEFDTLAIAEKSVKLLDKQELDGRPINVEVAKPRQEGAERPPRQPRQPRQPAANAGSAPAAPAAGAAAPKQPRAPRAQNGGAAQAAPAAGAAAGAAEGAPRRRRTRRPRAEGAAAPAGAAAGKQEGEEGARPRRQPRPARDDSARKPSETTLFVANLPFELTDDKFLEVFKGLGVAVKSAHVVVKQSGRSKGFGFAEFANADDQKKALEKLNGHKVGDRELVAKIALTESPATAQAK